MSTESINHPPEPAVASSDLLACPFCGGDAEADTQQGFRCMSDGQLGKAVAIYCTKCTAQIDMCYDDFPEYSPDSMLTLLKEAWNNRVANTKLSDLSPTRKETND